VVAAAAVLALLLLLLSLPQAASPMTATPTSAVRVRAVALMGFLRYVPVSPQWDQLWCVVKDAAKFVVLVGKGRWPLAPLGPPQSHPLHA
jgi:hypothetical protein